MRELKLEEIQQASLAILDEIDRICAKQHLTYYLAYGTLIGAVRHHGFIPWDDDLDIMMPRADYEKLRRYFKKKYEGKLKLCTRADTDRYIYGIYRVVDPSYVFENTNEYELGYDGGTVTGYFGKSTKEAVALFQRKAGLKPTGVATVRTQQLLFASDAPVYVAPTVIGRPVISMFPILPFVGHLQLRTSPS